MSDTEDAWREAVVLHRIPDSRQMREAFYLGARHSLNVILKTDRGEEDDAMIALNDELRAFAYATIGKPLPETLA